MEKPCEVDGSLVIAYISYKEVFHCDVKRKEAELILVRSIGIVRFVRIQECIARIFRKSKLIESSDCVAFSYEPELGESGG